MCIRDSIQADPSNDDYQFFRGTSLDNQQASILDRYKRFNNPEGNSVTDEDSPEDYPTQQTVIPTTEDINLDQNLAEGESYFHYALPLRPQDMVVGRNFITDRIEACLLYTSDAADERSSVDLGGRRIIKKKKMIKQCKTTTR